MNKNLDRRIHPIAEADGLSPKKLVTPSKCFLFFSLFFGCAIHFTTNFSLRDLSQAILSLYISFKSEMISE